MVAEEGSTFNMWQRGRQKIRECMKHKNGTTLIELIVTFALLGLFMTAATTMLTSSLQMFSRMQATSSAITVSDLILDKIAGEIVAADIPEKDMGRDNGYYFWLEPEKTIQLSETETVQGSQWVVFRNRSKSPIAIFASPAAAQGEDAIHGMGAGQLIIRYYAVSGDKDKTPQKGNQKAVEEIDWHFDNKVYMNYTIENLWFSRDNVQNHPNVIKINLILKNEQTGFKYFSYRYAENYNYDFGSGYMCTRDEIEPGNREFPIEAEEFKIKMLDGDGGDTGRPEPKPEIIVNYRFCFMNLKSELIRSVEYGSGVVGSLVQINSMSRENNKIIKIAPPYIKYYRYVGSKPMNGLELKAQEEENSLYLYYEPSETEKVPIVVIYKNRDTDEELDRGFFECTVESVFELNPKEIDGYESVSKSIKEIVTKDQVDPFYLEYVPKQSGSSITVTDSDGNKHILNAKYNWHDILEQAWSLDSGYDSNNQVDILYDETGFYIAINNSLHVPHNTGKITLKQFAEEKRNIIKISEDTRLLLESNMKGSSFDRMWKSEVKPRRGELVYYKREYYIAGGNGEELGDRDVPPTGGSWIKVPNLKK